MKSDSFTKYFLNNPQFDVYQKKIITIGAFDGCHLGHQYLLRKADVALTFSPLPKMYFSHYGKVLNTMEEKCFLYKKFVFMNFDEYLANLTADQFIEIVLTSFNPSKVIVGWDFHFGRNHAGSSERIKVYAKRLGFEVEICEPVRVQDEIVKSTKIRDYVQKGKIKKAKAFLGYDYFMFGKVVPGKGLGRELGFPTANLAISDSKITPKPGVYSGNIKVGRKIFKAAISVIKKDRLDIEAHILNFSDDIYGQNVKLSFQSFYRDQMQFKDSKALKTQIKDDVSKIQYNFDRDKG